MPYKSTFEFVSYDYGWRETWYQAVTDSLANAQARAVSVAKARRALLGRFAKLSVVSTLDIAQPRTVVSENLNIATVTARVLVNDTPTNTIAVRVVDKTFQYVKTWWLRGVPDEWVRYDAFGFADVAPDVLQAISNAMIVYGRNGFGWKVYDRNNALNAPVPVTNLGVDTNNTVRVSGLITCPAGQFVRITKVKGVNISQVKPGRRSVNGLWRVTQNTPGVGITIPLPVATLAGPPAWIAGGEMLRTVPIIVLLSPQAPGDISAFFARKSTGKPTRTIRGKARQAFRNFT